MESALAAPKSEARVAAAEARRQSRRGGRGDPRHFVERASRTPGRRSPRNGRRWRASGPTSAKLSALRPFADAGAPTLAALAASFAKIAPSVVAAATPPSGGGVMDRLLDHMRKLVRVRKVGEAAGDDAEALAARISAALARGDLAAALDAYHASAGRRAPGGPGLGSRRPRRARRRARRREALRADAVGRLAAAKN